VPIGRVIFEIGGVPIREELARDSKLRHFIHEIQFLDKLPVLRQAASKLPTKMEFIDRATPPRLGNLVLHPPPSLQPPPLDNLVASQTASP